MLANIDIFLHVKIMVIELKKRVIGVEGVWFRSTNKILSKVLFFLRDIIFQKT